MNRFLRLGLRALVAVAVAELLVRNREKPSDTGVAGAAGAPAPELSLRTLDGKQVDLKGLRGKVVAVNFWATWCGPCRAEMPELAELWRSRHDRCFEVLGVAGMSERKETERAARGIPYPVLFDEDGAAVDAWSVRAVPRTFVLDPEGRVRKVFRWAVDRERLAQAVDPLLPASCPARSG
jgi:cytochrome c biogenesis protein CcmG, thiol:disulfide interchange protein DsbE